MSAVKITRANAGPFFELLVELLDTDTEATHALVRVFYEQLEIGQSGGPRMARPMSGGRRSMHMVRSDYDVVRLLPGAASVTKVFSMPVDSLRFCRVELLRQIGREEHELS